MAQKTDTSKIERIREAAVEIISENGILNCSVASIARRAGVSVGYLYRHYPSKEELINDLLENTLNVITDKISALIEECSNIDEIVEGIVTFIIESAESNPHKHKFLIMLLNDFSIDIATQAKERIESIAGMLTEVGKHTCSLKKEITTDDLYVALVGIPMQYLSVHYKFNFNDYLADRKQLVDKIKVISLGIIKS